MTPGCCPYYHQAVELIGRRWTGAILAVLLEEGAALRFNEIAQAVPDLSDRLLAQRVKELEERGLVTKKHDGAYALTEMGRDLEPAVDALQGWGQRWLTQ
jgi:DNA-binding HxlR family transcriptional regulator